VGGKRSLGFWGGLVHRGKGKTDIPGDLGWGVQGRLLRSERLVSSDWGGELSIGPHRSSWGFDGGEGKKGDEKSTALNPEGDQEEKKVRFCRNSGRRCAMSAWIPDDILRCTEGKAREERDACMWNRRTPKATSQGKLRGNSRGLRNAERRRVPAEQEVIEREVCP